MRGSMRGIWEWLFDTDPELVPDQPEAPQVQPEDPQARPEDPRVQPMRVRGYVDGVWHGAVFGWCCLPDDPSTRLTAEVFVDGVQVAATRADALRETVAAAGFGDGRYGFRVPLPVTLADGGVHRLRVRAGGADLAAVPRFIPGRREDGLDGGWATTTFEPDTDPAQPALAPAQSPVAPVPAPARRPIGLVPRLGRGVALARRMSPDRRVLVRRISPDRRALLLVVAAVLVANLPYLLDVFDPNPLGPVSHLASTVHGGLLGGNPVLDPNIGYTSQALGHRAALDLVRLQLPWWNPYEATGAPLAADMQSAALFPPTLLLILGNGQLYEHVLFELIAGLSTFLLLRRIAVARWASTLGAIAFALNGTFAWFGHAAVNPVAFLPMTLLGLELAYSATAAGRRGGWWLLAVAGALSIYAGFPETAYVDALLALIWFAWRCRCGGRARWRVFAAKSVVGAIVAALLAAPLLIPFLRYLPDAFLRFHGSALYSHVHLPAVGIPQLFLPYVYGNADQFQQASGGTLRALWVSTGGYLTVSLVILAVLGLASSGRQLLRALLGAWLVLALARMYGLPGLGALLNLLPNMSSTQFYRYGWPAIELAVIVLASLGLDELGTVPGHPRRAAAIAAGGLVLIGVGAAGALSLVNKLEGSSPGTALAVALALGAVAVAALATAALLQSRQARIAVLSTLVVIEAVVMFALPELSAPRSVSVDLAPVSYLRAHLGLARFTTLGPLRPDYDAYFGASSINEIDLPLPKNWAGYVHSHLDRFGRPEQFVGDRPSAPGVPSSQDELLANLGAYRAAGVAYVVTYPGDALPQSRSTFTRVFTSPSAWIYGLAGASPYYSVERSGCGVDPQTRQSVRVTCTKPSVLVRRETYLPGWSAQVDGHSVPIGEADGLFQTVPVGTGSHQVIFSYAPRDIDVALVAFAAGLVWLWLGLSSRPGAPLRWRRYIRVRGWRAPAPT